MLQLMKLKHVRSADAVYPIMQLQLDIHNAKIVGLPALVQKYPLGCCVTAGSKFRLDLMGYVYLVIITRHVRARISLLQAPRKCFRLYHSPYYSRWRIARSR